MPSQSSIRHESIALSVASAATTLSENTREVMLAKLTPYLKDGETMPDAGLLQELLGRFLADRAGDLATADQAYSTAIRRHRALRIELVAAMAEVRRELRAVRIVFDRVFGPDCCKTVLGTRNFTSRDPGMLVRLVQQAANVFKDPLYTFDEKRDNALGVSSAFIAKQLEDVAGDLRELHEEQLEVQRIRRRAELARKDQKLAATKLAISEAAALIKGLFVFTGNRYQARRLRPSHRKKGGSKSSPLQV